MKIKLASENTCTGCLACVDVCNKGAIKSYIADDGHYYVKIDNAICIECGRCLKVCPLTIQFNYNKTDKSYPFAAWNTNIQQRMNSASGGVFAAIATTVLKENGIVIGVAMKNSEAYHCVIEKLEDIPLLQGSKYQQSNSLGIYKRTLNFLKTGKVVLFQGTPCQIGALLSYLGNIKYKNLITIDIVCGGVPSKLLINKFKKLNPNREIISYRDKLNGWGGYNLTVDNLGIYERNPQYSSIILKGFDSSYTNRYSCYNCQFTGLYRKADITIADFWGDVRFKEEHYNGISLMICHSNVGLEIAKRSTILMHEVSFYDSIKENPRLVCGRVPWKGNSFERRFLGWNFKHLPTSMIEALYTGKYNSILYFPYKMIKYIQWRILNIYFQKNAYKLTLKILDNED